MLEDLAAALGGGRRGRSLTLHQDVRHDTATESRQLMGIVVDVTPDEEICPECGLGTSPLGPVYRSRMGPMALPRVPGVEVCACGSEADDPIEAASRLSDDVRRLRAELNEILHGRPSES